MRNAPQIETYAARPHETITKCVYIHILNDRVSSAKLKVEAG